MDTIDDIGRKAAATLTAEAATIADAEIDAMLAALAAAAAARPQRAGVWASPAARERPPRRWAAIGAAAAVAAAVGAGALVVANRNAPSELVPGSTAPPSPVSTPPPTTTESSTSTAPDPTSAPSTSSPSTTAPTATTVPLSSGDGLAVSYKNPPPYLEPQLLATLQTEDASGSGGVAVMESGVVVLDGQTAHVVDWDGATRTVDVGAARQSDALNGIAAGPGQVLYAIASGNSTTNMTAAEVWAIPLTGTRSGEAVASVPTDLNVIVERPAASYGHGPTGLVDRIGRIDGVIAPYVDENGQPWPEPVAIPTYRTDGDTVNNIDGSQSWPLQIERAPGSSDTYNGPPPPTPAPGGGAVWWDSIGPPSSNTDYASGTMQVIAFLGTDGSVTWRRLPAGWGVSASDAWGTVLTRRNGTTLGLALATTTIASTPLPTIAEQTATDYLTALAARDYATAATLLGNDGQGLEDRADLAPIRDLLVSGADLEGALREWCEGDGPAACWMPARIVDGGATAPDDGYTGGTIVIADYDDRDIGAQGRFVVGEWEGQPSVFGLPPLVDASAVTRLRELLGVDVLWALHPDDQLAGGRRSAMLSTADGTRNVSGPLDVAAVAVAPDGQTLWWSVGDGRTIVTDTMGDVVCTTTEPIVDLVGEPGAYRAVVERLGGPGSPDPPVPTPAFEIDCITGVEAPTEPRSWNDGPVTLELVTVGERRFTLSTTDHHAELTDDAGLDLGMTGRPAFNADGSIVVYGNGAGAQSGDPNLTTVITASDTTGAEVWTYTSPTDVTAVYVAGDRAILTAAIDDGTPALGTASVVALDLTTGEVLMVVPATFDVLHVK